MQATYFGANGWQLGFSGLNVLLDPWLVGPLRFGNSPWFFESRFLQDWPIPPAIDLVLLTQGLPDHAHPPTLKELERSIPVVGSVAAAQVARALGFTQVTALAPGQSHQYTSGSGNHLTITATAGAAVPGQENGFLLRHPDVHLYVEPHGFLDPDLPPQQLDVVITPVVDLGLPLVGAFVRGQTVLPQLLERFQPRWVLASTAGGQMQSSGLLPKLLWSRGAMATATALLKARDSHARLLDPEPGRCYPLTLS
ncbi:MAG: beta-lactamase [Candidatus Synechococcus spongiarum SP3]|uniref:Beta-lactamase n=1 Tax=Candidatus Synechococcus spongiarum SP3 TaxID=1604020 RepID=A0A0G2J5R7_9SYNE|nr:MAG: beta-lactamase [Candidatus Synechococcus spongiarum SP3]